MLAYLKYKKDLKGMVKYRDRMYLKLKTVIEVHNIIVEQPSKVDKDVMIASIERVDNTIIHYLEELATINKMLQDYREYDSSLNKYGKHIKDNYEALEKEMKEVLSTLVDCAVGIREQIDLKQGV